MRIRNESHALGKTSLQDLLSDDLCRLAMAVFRLGATRRAPAAWQLASSEVLALRAVAPDDDIGAAKVEPNLTAFLACLRADMAASPSRNSAADFATRVFEYLDLAAIARAHAEYGVGGLLGIILEAFCLHFFASADGAADWTACLDAFDGVNLIPMMTVHKSKGLEYDTIVFVGVDDQAWWAHVPGDPEGVAAFFVALSRAKQRAIFCQDRAQIRSAFRRFRPGRGGLGRSGEGLAPDHGNHPGAMAPNASATICPASRAWSSLFGGCFRWDLSARDFSRPEASRTRSTSTWSAT
ncbi:3'-5' exonuclease [Mesorhizobium sp.]|uniref:3'-5' exonuclease n=1 Tax=Mesorhizobium sp. TaxID=1871066 RepID=UPI0025FAF55E|nr:3'-5' exonuclease [Mesorhizobium sp.]